MALKDKLGLALIPSAYSGVADENNAGGTLGKVHSVFPKQTTSENLITNGDFSDGSNGWSINLGTTIISNGVAEFPDATLSYLIQSNVVDVQVQTYILTYTIKTSNGGNLQLGGGSNPFGFQSIPNTIGTHTLTLTSDGVQRNLQFRNGNSFIGTIDDISLVKVIDGDFDFSRGSDATRVNSQGYIESVQVLSDELVQNGDFEEIGSELITNGGFDGNADNWSVGSEWNYVNGTLQYPESATLNNPSQQVLSTNLIAGKLYKIEFDVITETTGSILFRLRQVDNGNEDLTIGYENFSQGKHQFFYTPLEEINRIQIWGLGSSDTFAIDNVSVKEVGQNWTFSTNTSIIEVNGNLKAKFNNATSGGFYTTNNVLTANKKYKYSFNVEKISGTSIDASFTERPSLYTVIKNPIVEGLNQGTFTATESVAIGFGLNGGNSAEFTIDNVSLVEITDDTDIPRLDYTNQACPSLLLEPQRTNLIDSSEYFKSSKWTIGSGNIDDNTTETLSPQGLYNASKVYDNTYASLYNSQNPVTQSTQYTLSFYVKGTVATPQLAVYDESNSSFISVDVAYTITSDWTRIEHTFTTPSGCSLVRVYPIRGVGSATFYLWGCQLEEGSYATSYIPTNGSSVTRLADVCNNAGDSTIFNDAEGVLFAEIDTDSTSINNTIALSDGTSNNAIRLGFSTTQVNYTVYVSGFQVNNTQTRSVGGYNKVAIKYKANDFALWVNGVEVNVDPSGSLPPDGTFNQIRFDRGDSPNPFYGNVRQLLYFNEALTDEELEALTSSRTSEVLKNYQRRGELLGATYESAHVENKLNELF